MSGTPHRRRFWKRRASCTKGLRKSPGCIFLCGVESGSRSEIRSVRLGYPEFSAMTSGRLSSSPVILMYAFFSHFSKSGLVNAECRVQLLFTIMTARGFFKAVFFPTFFETLN